MGLLALCKFSPLRLTLGPVPILASLFLSSQLDCSVQKSLTICQVGHSGKPGRMLSPNTHLKGSELAGRKQQCRPPTEETQNWIYKGGSCAVWPWRTRVTGSPRSTERGTFEAVKGEMIRTGLAQRLVEMLKSQWRYWAEGDISKEQERYNIG